MLGSVGWQQWSKFGQVQLGIDNATNPTSLTKNLDFKDTWYFALGGRGNLVGSYPDTGIFFFVANFNWVF